MSEVGEKFTMATAVTDSLAEDKPMLAALEAHCIGAGWEGLVIESGGRTLSPPTLRREPNEHYGKPMTDEDGEIIRDEDGRPVLDRIKFYLVASGRAVRL